MLSITQSKKVIPKRLFLSWDLYDKCKAWKSRQRTFQGQGTAYAEVLVWERALTDAEKSRAEAAVTQGQGRQAPPESRTFSRDQEKFGLHSKYNGKPLQALGERHGSLFIALLYGEG